MRRLILVTALGASLLLALAGSVAARSDTAATKLSGPVELQLITISDWHGQIPPLEISGVGRVGGAAALATYIKQARAENPNTLVFMAGDSFGATPPISSFFEERPAVQAMNLMGVDADTFGNHNFDRGIDHLQQMVDLAEFPFVSANLRNLAENLTGVDKMTIFQVGGIRVAVIGITNEEAPTLVTPGSLGTIEITDSVAAANQMARAARRAADIVVVLTHKGIRGFNPDGSAFGELIDFAEGVNPSLIDVIVGDHTDFQFADRINGITVVENKSKGATWAKIELTVGGAAAVPTVEIAVPFTNAVTPDPTVQAFIDDLNAQLAPILGRVIGESTVDVPRSDQCGRADGRLCESLIGNFVTDAMRGTYGADLAITNSGGLRAALTCPAAGPAGFCPAGITPPPFPITRGSVLGVLPFGNVVATTILSGAEVRAFLENGVSSMPGANGRFAQVSGLCFAYDIEAAVGSRVTSIVRQAADETCTGAPVLPGETFTVAINDFMMNGGDGYPNVAAKSVTRNIMDADVADYVVANTPISPSIQGRITCTDPNPGSGNNCPVIISP
jgi:2',3'-cyclic-nucleotide 2'-phosphodiesterase (5'-nucleotidase family)